MSSIREGPAPRGRKLLFMNVLTYPSAVFVDDDGLCEYPVCKGGPHHLYADEEGRKWAMRCPKSLTEEEKRRTFADFPPGAARDAAKNLKETLLAERGRPKTVRRRYDEHEDR